MPIPKEYEGRFVYHFTHLENLEGLLKTGFLANNHPGFPQDKHTSVAEKSIQKRRATMQVTCGPGGVVHDYVPLYFGSKSPMLLAVINKKNVDQMCILYFEYPISIIENGNVVFTDAAANTVEPPNFYSNPEDLAKLNWTEIDSRKWSSENEELKHQRMAEVLVHHHLPLKLATRVVVWNQSIKEWVQEKASEVGVELPAICFEDRMRPHYFVKFMEGKQTESLVIGPIGIANRFEEACEKLEKGIGQNVKAQFDNPKRLLEALREDFGAVPQTAELVGLKSANVAHKFTVDVHTQQVVKKLKSLSEFVELDSKDQDRIELAAYLHDIGKGPKSRWKEKGGLQQVDPDHPVRAIPMVVEILGEQVKKVKLENAKLILKLVCYHDLVGDVLGKGRDEQQIIDVAEDERELRMLFALGRADATSLTEEWWNENKATELFARCLAAIESKSRQ